MKPENVVTPIVRPAGPIDPKYIRRGQTLRLHAELNRYLGIGRPATRRELALHEQIDRRLLADPGGADAWIVSELGCTPAMVARRRKALGLGPSDTHRRRVEPREKSRVLAACIAAALEADPGATNLAVAKLVGCCLDSVAKHRGGPSAFARGERERQTEARRLLAEDPTATTLAIATRVGCAPKTVRRLRLKLGAAPPSAPHRSPDSPPARARAVVAPSTASGLEGEVARLLSATPAPGTKAWTLTEIARRLGVSTKRVRRIATKLTDPRIEERR